MSDKNNTFSPEPPAEQAWSGCPTVAVSPVSAVPSDAECLALWDAYGMLPNIRAHSLLVACLATELATRAREKGVPVNVAEVRVAGLLHDLAKTYTIRHGGNHCQLGGAWVQELTGNAAVAQGVVYHAGRGIQQDRSQPLLQPGSGLSGLGALGQGGEGVTSGATAVAYLCGSAQTAQFQPEKAGQGTGIPLGSVHNTVETRALP